MLAATRWSCSTSTRSMRNIFRTRADSVGETLSTAEFTAASVSSTPVDTGQHTAHNLQNGTVLLFCYGDFFRCWHFGDLAFVSINYTSVKVFDWLVDLLIDFMNIGLLAPTHTKWIGHAIDCHPLYVPEQATHTHVPLVSKQCNLIQAKVWLYYAAW